MTDSAPPRTAADAVRTGAFGDLLRHYRSMLGLTQEALAEQAALSRRGIADLERGARRSPHPATVARLASALGLLDAARHGFELAARAERTSYRSNRVAARPPPTADGATESSVVRLTRAQSRHALGLLPERAPLVGRVHELGLLESEYEAVLHERSGRLVLISGEPGVGKTRLARELGEHVRRQGGIFLEGQYLRDGTPPYGPWVQALGPLLHELGEEDLRRVVGSFRNDLARIFPELANPMAASAPSMGSTPEHQHRLFDGVAAVVANLSARRPLVLLLDDLQWSPGLSLIGHVARRLTRSPTLLLGTYREHEFRDQAELMRDWADLNRARMCVQLQLAPLAEEHATELVAHYVGAEPAELIRALVYHYTRGNAFFIEEVLRSLAQSGAVRATVRGWQVQNLERIQIPETMKLAVEERVARLGSSTRELLVQAAILGQEFSFVALQALAGQPEDQLVAGLDQAVAARVLVDRSVAGEERFAFVDDQIQEVLYTSLPPLRRRRYHLRAGQALEQVHSGQLYPHLEELARHFAEGTHVDKAAGYANQAADKCCDLFQWRRATQLYERSLDQLKYLPASSEIHRRRFDTLLKLVHVGFTLGAPERTTSWLNHAEELAAALPIANGSVATPSEDMLDDRRRHARLAYWLARSRYLRCEFVVAKAHAEHALALAEASDDSQGVLLATAVLGGILWYQGYAGQALPLLEKVAGPLENAASAWEWTWAAGYLAVARVATGDYLRGLADIHHVVARTRALADPHCLALGYFQLALVYFLGGESALMRESSCTCLKAANECGDQYCLYLAPGFRAWADSRLGQHAAAREGLASSNVVGQALSGSLFYADWFAAAEAELALNAEDPVDACSLAEQAVARARQVGGLFAEGLAHRTWAQALAARSPTELDQAQAHMADALRCFEGGGVRIEVARTHLVWARLLARSGDPGAHWHLQQAAQQFESFGLLEELRRTRAALASLP